MHVTRITDAPSYEAPNHFDMRGVRLQGWDVSDTKAFWVGLSHFLPGGGVHRDATDLEKVYVLLQGELVIRTDDRDETLRPLDSCHLPAGEARSIENRGPTTATMVVVMPYPEGAR